ncbi:GNAT family N-acetyltransferase [Salinibacterium sp. M195]|nr:GNAT family N-acetyltransferase [Salinibacterium sp. M195]
MRDFIETDADKCYEWMRDPQSVEMAAFTAPDPDDRDEFDTWITRVLANPTITAKAICSDGALVGMLATFTLDDHRELTYWVDRAHWGQGIATTALALLLDIETHRPLRARTAAHNVRSAAVVTRNGFVETERNVDFAEGLKRDSEEIIFELF